jgi:hypothetical protein
MPGLLEERLLGSSSTAAIPSHSTGDLLLNRLLRQQH